MLRRSHVALRVSTFSLFMKDLSAQGKLAGSKNPAKEASKAYHKLTTAEKAALKRRAERMTYPALDAYNRFQKEYAQRFTHLPNKERQRKVAALWAELKANGTVHIPKAPKKKTKAAPAKAKAKVKAAPAKKKVKAAAKAVKASSKPLRAVPKVPAAPRKKK